MSFIRRGYASKIDKSVKFTSLCFSLMIFCLHFLFRTLQITNFFGWWCNHRFKLNELKIWNRTNKQNVCLRINKFQYKQSTIFDNDTNAYKLKCLRCYAIEIRICQKKKKRVLHVCVFKNMVSEFEVSSVYILNIDNNLLRGVKFRLWVKGGMLTHTHTHNTHCITRRLSIWLFLILCTHNVLFVLFSFGWKIILLRLVGAILFVWHNVRMSIQV